MKSASVLEHFQSSQKLHAIRNYETKLLIKHGSIQALKSLITDSIGEKVHRLCVIVDQGLLRHHPNIKEYLNNLEKSNEAIVYVVPGGEKAKSLSQITKIIRWLDNESSMRRSEPVIAIGGGRGFGCCITRS